MFDEDAAPSETREVSVEDAKKEILVMFKNQRGQDIYYSDAAAALNLDFATVIRAFEELEKAGLIQGASR